MKTIRVWPQVFADDVTSELGDSIPELAEIVRVFAGPEDDQLTLPERVVAALAYPPLCEGLTADWAEPYLDAGATGRCVDAVKRLRIRNAPGFAIVHEMQHFGLDNDWQLRGNLACPTRPPSPAGVHLPLVYTLGLSVEPPTGAPMPSFEMRADGSTSARRPYASAPEKYPEVEQLAAHLAPRIETTFGGVHRLAEQPVLAPICAAVASVSLAMRERPMRTRGRKPKYRADSLAACLQALDLAEHETTLTRIILRNHRDHIPMDVSGAPERFTMPAWQGRLALFTFDDEGTLNPALPDEFYYPPALFSLVQPEPL